MGTRLKGSKASPNGPNTIQPAWIEPCCWPMAAFATRHQFFANIFEPGQVVELITTTLQAPDISDPIVAVPSSGTISKSDRRAAGKTTPVTGFLGSTRRRRSSMTRRAGSGERHTSPTMDMRTNENTTPRVGLRARKARTRSDVAIQDRWNMAAWPRWKRVCVNWLLLPIAAVLAVMIFEAHVYSIHIVSGASMAPALLPGDWVLVDRRARGTHVRVGETVLTTVPFRKGLLLKRLAGMGSDTASMADGRLRVNGSEYTPGPPLAPWVPPYGFVAAPMQPMGEIERRRLLAMQTAHAVPEPGLEDWGPIPVPHDSIFLLGDNRWSSLDSRTFGFVHLDAIGGRAVRVIFSTHLWASEGFLGINRLLPQWERIGQKVEAWAPRD